MRALAEAPRLLFHYTNIEYEDRMSWDYFDKEWVKFKSSVNPEDPIIRLDSILVNDNNERLFSSIMMRQDTFDIYSTFFTKKKSIMDIEMINIDSYLSYNKRKLAFVINGKDFLDVKRLAEKTFRKVNFFKPESSRDNSKETYIHCKGIKTL